MRPVLTLLRVMLRDQRTALLRGALLSVTVLLMGAALLGLSGWFITAAAAAGLAGVGVMFDVFRPSALIRFLALGRTAARYGERLLTHDATLRALAGLRVRLLDGLVRAPHDRLTRLRAAQMLNRVSADVETLDGLPLRLVLPILAALATLLIAFFALWALVELRLALLVAGGYAAGGTVVLIAGIRAARKPSRRAETAAQAFRSRLVDLIGARTDLAIYGQLATRTAHTDAARTRRDAETARLDRIERRAGAALSLTTATVTAGALWLGGTLAATGTIAPATAAIAVFTALALAEALAPLRRALTEQGRIIQAARRVAPMLAEAPAPPADGPTPTAPLALHAVTYRRSPTGRAILDHVDLTLTPGTTTALAGPSGTGKSTLLLIAAGLLPPDSGTATLGGKALHHWPEPALRRAITLVPQRASLLEGTVAENLRLAAPDADDATLWHALDTVCLADTLRARGGLDTRLGPRGAGLSGGEARRLVLARALLRRPAILLLDEPTEGLDAATARAVIANLRAALPDSALLIAAHRAEELASADTTLALNGTLARKYAEPMQFLT